MDYQELFNYMANNHDVLLLESEMNEIIYIVKQMLNNSEAHVETPNVNNNEGKKEFYCICKETVLQTICSETRLICPKCGGVIVQ